MNDTPDLGRLIAYCGRLGRQYMDQNLRRAGYDVTPVQSRTLVYLSCCGRREVNQRDLERELRLKPSTINGIVNRLEEKGYILRRTSPEDGRCRLVSLTASGQEKVDTFSATMEETGKRFSSCLSAEEEEKLRELLIRIIENLESEVNNV
ncbi:MAG: MarR family transcriptional regulator [Oscillibacter sp.]|nr:MarR family transcriptional regulator [Oscillibacter sp.]